MRFSAVCQGIEHWLSAGNCGVNHHITALHAIQLNGILLIGKDQKNSKASVKVDTVVKRLGIKRNWIKYFTENKERKQMNTHQILWTVSKMVKKLCVCVYTNGTTSNQPHVGF